MYLAVCGIAFPGIAQEHKTELKSGLIRDFRSGPDYTVQDSMQITEMIDHTAVKFQHKNPDSALAILKSSLLESLQKGFVYGIYKSSLALGVMHAERGDYAKADTLYRQTYAFCYALGGVYPSIWHNNMGQLKVYMGSYEEAYLHFDTAMTELAGKNIKNDVLSSMIYGNVGALFKILKEPEKAVYYGRKSLETALLLKDSSLVCHAYNNLGSTYSQMGNYTDAVRCYQAAIGIARETGENASLQIAFLNLGELYWVTNQNDKAIFYLQKAVDVSGHHNPYHSRAIPNLYLSDIFLSVKDYVNARKYAKEAILAGNSIEAKGILSDAYLVLSKTDYALGRYKDAYHHLNTYLNYFDSTLSIEKYKTIQELETVYRTTEKDNELIQKKLLLAQKEKSIQQKNFWIWVIAFGSMMTGVIIFIFFRHNQKLQAAKWSNMQKDREITHFKAIIQGEEKERARIAHELHDGIISQLTAVKIRFSSLIHQEGPVDRYLFEQGFHYLEETMQDLRKTAHNLMPETVARRGLSGALQEFCNKLENDNATRVHLIINDNRPLDSTLELSLYRIVQELVQNVLKHAAAGTLILQIHYFDNLLSVTVEDDGTGFDPVTAHKGTGLENVKERVASMGGHVSISSEAGKGTSVYLEIPIEKSTTSSHAHDKSSYNR